ncbi:LRRC6 [Mytilus edulis]|uniref:LRRC6 n=1 Tax=Mytilus edulis TaxID=6550 RepID=A0A8S3QIH0_MYTED|nr:LRRC6 [Mytilus edulis]
MANSYTEWHCDGELEEKIDSVQYSELIPDDSLMDENNISTFELHGDTFTENLVRRKAEHNDLEISTLEEVSLHQQDIEKIEHLDKWCRELKILYLQSNLIPKIENVGRLKKLEYLNLALNNVEKIENLSGCESLQKLDMTVNFVGELTSIENLKDLVHFRELYLTGNPCTEYEGYREYVITTLPHLQDYAELRNKIIKQQEAHRQKRVLGEKQNLLQNQELKSINRWKNRKLEKIQKVDFTLTEDENKPVYLRHCSFKHMDTSLVDVDVQTNYVKVIMKGKILQLCMTEDINADSSSAKRSQVTGHLLITMPKVKPLIKPKHIIVNKDENKENNVKEKRKTHEKLEVDKKAHKTVDIANIVSKKSDKVKAPFGSKVREAAKERPNSEDFVDDLDVPPLE